MSFAVSFINYTRPEWILCPPSGLASSSSFTVFNIESTCLLLTHTDSATGSQAQMTIGSLCCLAVHWLDTRPCGKSPTEIRDHEKLRLRQVYHSESTDLLCQYSETRHDPIIMLVARLLAGCPPEHVKRNIYTQKRVRLCINVWKRPSLGNSKPRTK